MIKSYIYYIKIKRCKEDFEKEKLSYEAEFEDWLQKFKDLKLAYSPDGIKRRSEELNAELEECTKTANNLEITLKEAMKKLTDQQSGNSRKFCNVNRNVSS